MSGINGVGPNNPVQKIVSQPILRQTPAEPVTGGRMADKLELSGVGHLLTSLKSQGIRTEKVSAIKAQIERGTYEDDAKLNTAVDRMLDDLNL